MPTTTNLNVLLPTTEPSSTLIVTGLVITLFAFLALSKHWPRRIEEYIHDGKALRDHLVSYEDQLGIAARLIRERRDLEKGIEIPSGIPYTDRLRSCICILLLTRLACHISSLFRLCKTLLYFVSMDTSVCIFRHISIACYSPNSNL